MRAWTVHILLHIYFLGLKWLQLISQEWYCRFQVTGMIEWVQKSKPKKSLDQNLTPKKSHAESLSHKNFQKALNDITIMNLQIVLNTPKNPFVNQAAKKILAKIFLPKKIPKPKISNPKTFLDHSCRLKSGVPPSGTTTTMPIKYSINKVWNNDFFCLSISQKACNIHTYIHT